VDDVGYPSGFAAGKSTSEKPELRMRALSIERRLAVKEDVELKQDMKPARVRANTEALPVSEQSPAACSWNNDSLLKI
jgi:hypothetical protein